MINIQIIFISGKFTRRSLKESRKTYTLIVFEICTNIINSLVVPMVISYRKCFYGKIENLKIAHYFRKLNEVIITSLNLYR